MDWLRQLPIGQYVADQRPKGGWLQRLDPRLKLAWTLAFLLTPILAGPFWRLTLVGMLLLITLASGLPLRLWRRSLPGLMALALAVGLLGALLPASTTPPGSLQRPPSELRLSPGPQGSPAPSRAGLPWEVVNWGPLKLGSTALGPLVITRKSATLGINSGTLLFTVIHSANLLLLTTPPGKNCKTCCALWPPAPSTCAPWAGRGAWGWCWPWESGCWPTCCCGQSRGLTP